MSWQVEGKTYHNYEEYQRAKADAERRKAERSAAELVAENRGLSEQIARDQRAMDEVRDDVRKQMEISRRVESNVNALRRNQERMDQVVRQSESRMQEGLKELENDLGGKIEATNANIEALRENNRRQTEDIRKSLSALREESLRGLAEAEERRRATEERLKQSVQEVDRKVENDRAERARQTADRAALANTEIVAAEAALERLESDKYRLDMSAIVQKTSAQIGAARTMLALDNVSAALAAGTMARAEAESAETEAWSRTLEMEQSRGSMRRRIEWISRSLGSDASQDLQDCYAREMAQVRHTLSAASDRLGGRYQNFRLLQFESKEDSELLDRLEADTLEMISTAPVAAEAAEKRMARLEEVLAKLERVYGQMTTASQRFSVADDPKSDLIFNAEFGSSKVEMKLALDGSISVDGYGHGSAGSCAAAAHQIVQELQKETLVRDVVVDDYDRTLPRNQVQSRAADRKG